MHMETHIFLTYVVGPLLQLPEISLPRECQIRDDYAAYGYVGWTMVVSSMVVPNTPEYYEYIGAGCFQLFNRCLMSIDVIKVCMILSLYVEHD